MKIRVAALLALSASSALAQPTRRDVPAGEVTGLEVGVDGSLRVAPGGTLRWFVTVYEVVRSRDLRPSPGTRVVALASFSRAAPVAEGTTDALGRASLSFAVPDTLEGPFDLALDATSPRGVTRRFDVQVTLTPRRRLSLVLGRTEVSPRERFWVVGRVSDQVSGRPDRGRTVQLSTRAADGGTTRQSVTTDARGAFVAELRAPRASGNLVVTAETEGAAAATVTASVGPPAPAPALVVRVAPSRTLVPPGAMVDVDVVVRTPDGRPVRGAILAGLSIPAPRQGDREHRAIQPLLTGADGRARAPWQVIAAPSGADVQEVRGELHVLRAGIGAGDAEVAVRVTRSDSVVEWAVEGGAFAPGLPGKLFVRVVAPDGAPRVRAEVQIEDAAERTVTAMTDEAGVATLELPSITTSPPGEDECGGATVARLVLRMGSREEPVCAPVDPDATIRVTAPPMARPGAPLGVTLARAASVSRATVQVTALAHDGDAWTPVADALAAAGVNRVSLALPAELTGEVWVRARPLLRNGEPVRGGGTLVYLGADERLAVRLGVDGQGSARVALAGAGDERVSAFAFALPEAEGRALLGRLRDVMDPVAKAIDEGATLPAVAGLLGARTPLDVAAPAALRGRATEPLPMPEGPVELGVLRDPWRTRARFVRGRLGRLLRALEERVRERLPDDVEEVAVRGPRGWTFNTEVLAHVVSDIGPEGATALDGSELTVESLSTLDPQITFDNVARRLTRERLLGLLVNIAHFVRGHQLDYAFARRGDPTGWLPALLSDVDQETGEVIERATLFDGWGQALAIRPARGGRARFRFLEPIPGYEVVSAGPDGRFGTGDDLWDPFARVLTPGSVFANAVGEDVLLARLGGVELGRATVSALSAFFEVEQTGWTEEPVASAQVTWGDAPAPVPIDPRPLATRAVGGRPAIGAASVELGPAGGTLTVGLPEEARRVLVVAGAMHADGRASFDGEPLEAGAPVLVTGELPTRLHAGEEVLVPIRLAWLGEPANRQLEVVAEGHGAVRVEIVGEGRVTAPPERPAVVTLRITGARTGGGSLSVVVRGDAPLRTLTSRVAVTPAGLLRAQHDGALVKGEAHVETPLPDDARAVRAELIVSAGASGTARDPGFETATRRRPSLLAWTWAMRGEAPPDDLQAAMRAAGTSGSPLAVACAVVGWSAIPDDEDGEDALAADARAARAAVTSVLHMPDDPAAQMAVLVALAGASSGIPAARGGDPVSALAEHLRDRAWALPRSARDRPALLARGAAGLLLADPRDMVGRQLLEQVRQGLVDGPREGLVLPARTDRPGDEWIGTLALAIAARQIGEDALADRLARGAAPRAYLAMRDDEESAFWWLAASVFGVLGADGSTTAVEVRTNGGGYRRIALQGGLARVPLSASSPSADVRSTVPVFARIEARYARPVVDEGDGPMSIRIEGDPGHSGEAAALQLVVTSAVDETIERPVVELLLPGAAAWTPAARRAIAAASSVHRVSRPDAAGLVRLHLTALGPRAEVRIPLPVRWIGEGRTAGIPIVAYDAARPHASSSRAGRRIVVTERPEERW